MTDDYRLEEGKRFNECWDINVDDSGGNKDFDNDVIKNIKEEIKILKEETGIFSI